MKVDPDQLYFSGDMCLCGKHLGMHARATGRDIRGGRVAKVTKEDILEWTEDPYIGHAPMCENRECSEMVEQMDGTFAQVAV